MSLKNNNPTKTIAWGKLNNHFREIKNKKISKYFDENSNRNNELTIKWKDFYVDFSKNRLEKKTINLFTELLKEIDLKDSIDKYFNGDRINKTENRAVLHTALRAENNSSLKLDGVYLQSKIKSAKNKI